MGATGARVVSKAWKRKRKVQGEKEWESGKKLQLNKEGKGETGVIRKRKAPQPAAESARERSAAEWRINRSTQAAPATPEETQS
jgi:hypothetical protein